MIYKKCSQKGRRNYPSGLFGFFYILSCPGWPASGRKRFAKSHRVASAAAKRVSSIVICDTDMVRRGLAKTFARHDRDVVFLEQRIGKFPRPVHAGGCEISSITYIAALGRKRG